MLAHGTGCVPTSSMGRLFDAVSSLLGVRHEITYEGQAAIELEHVASATGSDVTRPSLRFTVGDDGVIACGEVVGDLVDGLRAGIDVAGLAAAFHEAVVELVVDVARRARVDRAIETVGLTGGVFQNALLVEWTQQRLAEEGFEVLRHRVVPPNDGGLALGQVIAAGRRS
jgi:hydrogenase maturation protein HypF